MTEFRKIIHVDMDAFYASVEQRDNPELKGRPVAVGGSKLRGVVAAASYEARKYGVRSAMPSITAYKKCPHIVFVKPRFEVYKSVSNQIREIFKEYTDLIEPLSLDEAYLDVTDNKFQLEYATDVAIEIKKRIKEKTGLTASAGISYNKFLAKISSDYNKPDGYYVVTPSMAERFIEQLPIEKFFGVGKVTAKKMHSKGIFTGLDLKTKTKEELVRSFGKSGRYYYSIVRGIDNREVNPSRIRKSVGAERTFFENVTTKEALQDKVEKVAEVLVKRIEKAQASGKTLTLKIKYGDFKQITRSHTKLDFLTEEEVYKVSLDLVDLVEDIENGIRLVGLQLSNFAEKRDVFLGQLELGL